MLVKLTELFIFALVTFFYGSFLPIHFRSAVIDSLISLTYTILIT